jgi:hypothetical protein
MTTNVLLPYGALAVAVHGPMQAGTAGAARARHRATVRVRLRA